MALMRPAQQMSDLVLEKIFREVATLSSCCLFGAVCRSTGHGGKS
jgi:hypothetical protein